MHGLHGGGDTECSHAIDILLAGVFQVFDPMTSCRSSIDPHSIFNGIYGERDGSVADGVYRDLQVGGIRGSNYRVQCLGAPGAGYQLGASGLARAHSRTRF